MLSIFVVGCFFFSFSELALAYIDPVSGSIIIQSVIAAIIGAIAFFRRSITKAIKSLFGNEIEESESKD